MLGFELSRYVGVVDACIVPICGNIKTRKGRLLKKIVGALQFPRREWKRLGE